MAAAFATCPGLQEKQVDAPRTEVLPASHGVQTVVPVVDESQNVPSRQSVQAEVDDARFPSPHTEHVVRPVDVAVLGSTQAGHDVVPVVTALAVPTGHALQAVPVQ